MLRDISGIVGRLLRLAVLIAAIVAAVEMGRWLLGDTQVALVGLAPPQAAPAVVGLTSTSQSVPTATLTINIVPIAIGIAGLMLLGVIGLLLVRRLRRPQLNAAAAPRDITKPLIPQTRGLPIYQPGALTRSTPAFGLAASRPTVPPDTSVITAVNNAQTTHKPNLFHRPPAPETRPVTMLTQPINLEITRQVPPPPSVQPEWPPTPSYGTEYGAYGSYDDLFPPAEPDEDMLIHDLFRDPSPSIDDNGDTKKIEPDDRTRNDIFPTLPPIP